LHRQPHHLAPAATREPRTDEKNKAVKGIGGDGIVTGWTCSGS